MQQPQQQQHEDPSRGNGDNDTEGCDSFHLVCISFRSSTTLEHANESLSSFFRGDLSTMRSYHNDEDDDDEDDDPSYASSSTLRPSRMVLAKTVEVIKMTERLPPPTPRSPQHRGGPSPEARKSTSSEFVSSLFLRAFMPFPMAVKSGSVAVFGSTSFSPPSSLTMPNSSPVDAGNTSAIVRPPLPTPLLNYLKRRWKDEESGVYFEGVDCHRAEGEEEEENDYDDSAAVPIPGIATTERGGAGNGDIVESDRGTKAKDKNATDNPSYFSVRVMPGSRTCSSSSLDSYWSSSSLSSSSSSSSTAALSPTSLPPSSSSNVERPLDHEVTAAAAAKPGINITRLKVPSSTYPSVFENDDKAAEASMNEQRYQSCVSKTTHLSCTFVPYANDRRRCGKVTDIADRDRVRDKDKHPTTTSSRSDDTGESSSPVDSNDNKHHSGGGGSDYSSKVGNVNSILRDQFDYCKWYEHNYGPSCAVVYSVDVGFLFVHRLYRLDVMRRAGNVVVVVGNGKNKDVGCDEEGGGGGGEDTVETIETAYLSLLYKEKTKLHNFLSLPSSCQKPLFFNFTLDHRLCAIPKDDEEYRDNLDCFFDVIRDYFLVCDCLGSVHDAFSSKRFSRFRGTPSVRGTPIPAETDDGNEPKETLCMFFHMDAPVPLPRACSDGNTSTTTSTVSSPDGSKERFRKKARELEKWSEGKLLVLPFSKRFQALYDTVAHFYMVAEPSREERTSKEILFFDMENR